MARCTEDNEYGRDRVEQQRSPSLCETMARCSFDGLEYPSLFIWSRQNNFLRKDECKSKANDRSRIGTCLRTTNNERHAWKYGKKTNNDLVSCS
eukprot:10870478-Heterocapsa_arctica.AAC.1